MVAQKHTRVFAGQVARNWVEQGVLDAETLQTTVEACAWLIGIAEMSVKHGLWGSEVVRWLDAIGSASHEELQKLHQ